MIQFLLFAILLVLLIVFLPGLLAALIVIAVCSFLAFLVLLIFGQQAWFWLVLGAGICVLVLWKLVAAVIHANRMRDFVSWGEDLPNRLASQGIKAWLYRSGDKPRFIFVDNTGDAVAEGNPLAYFYCGDGEMHEELIAIEEEARTWQKNLKLPEPAYSNWVFGRALSSMTWCAKSALRERDGGRTAKFPYNYVFLALMK